MTDLVVCEPFWRNFRRSSSLCVLEELGRLVGLIISLFAALQALEVSFVVLPRTERLIERRPSTTVCTAELFSRDCYPIDPILVARISESAGGQASYCCFRGRVSGPWIPSIRPQGIILCLLLTFHLEGYPKHFVLAVAWSLSNEAMLEAPRMHS